MSPSCRRALELLHSYEWVNGEDLRSVAGSRYGARLDELKALGYRWDKKWIKGYAVPWYRLHPPAPVQLELADEWDDTNRAGGHEHWA